MGKIEQRHLSQRLELEIECAYCSDIGGIDVDALTESDYQSAATFFEETGWQTATIMEDPENPTSITSGVYCGPCMRRLKEEGHVVEM